MNITWGDVRSAVHSKDYEMQARAYLWLNSNEMRHYLCSQEQWMHATGFGQFVLWCHEVINGNLERMASVAYMIMAGGHHQAWMHYAMEWLRVVNNGPANAADVIWWWCSASDVLFQRIQDAGHAGVTKDHVWQLLCSAACWEMARPHDEFQWHESLGTAIEYMEKMYLCTLWPSHDCFDDADDARRCDRHGWIRLTDYDWVVCVANTSVDAPIQVTCQATNDPDLPFLRGIEAAKCALGTWVEEDDSIWGDGHD